MDPRSARRTRVAKRPPEPRLVATMLIAPCGLNCGVCRAYIRKNNPCPGCRAGDARKPVRRVRCAIKTCPRLAASRQRFCDSCKVFPCGDVQRLEKRYRTRYGVSPIANLQRIKAVGVRRFGAEEKRRWQCATCRGTLCMHEALCRACGYARQEEDRHPSMAIEEAR